MEMLILMVLEFIRKIIEMLYWIQATMYYPPVITLSTMYSIQVIH
jgi:hypothetical protein